MRLLRTIAALSAALIPLTAEAAFTRPMPGTAQFPRASNPQIDEPVCFLKTPGGTTFDLVSLCGTNAAPQNTAPAPSNPANAPANNPNPAAAPNPNSVTRDAAGEPITTPAGTANPNNPNNPNVNPNNPNNPNVNPGTAPNPSPNVNPGTAPNPSPNVNPRN